MKAPIPKRLQGADLQSLIDQGGVETSGAKISHSHRYTVTFPRYRVADEYSISSFPVSQSYLEVARIELGRQSLPRVVGSGNAPEGCIRIAIINSTIVICIVVVTIGDVGDISNAVQVTVAYLALSAFVDLVDRGSWLCNCLG